MSKQEYFHYSGTGNTFILLDQRHIESTDLPELAEGICKAFSVDGLLVMKESQAADIRPTASQFGAIAKSLRSLGWFSHPTRSYKASAQSLGRFRSREQQEPYRS